MGLTVVKQSTLVYAWKRQASFNPITGKYIDAEAPKVEEHDFEGFDVE